MTLLEAIKSQYSQSYADLGITNCSLEEIYSLMEKILTTEVSDSNFSDLEKILLPNMQNSFQKLDSTESLNLLAEKLEVFIRKILILTDESGKVPKADDGNIYLKELVKYLGIDANPNIKFARDERNALIHNAKSLPSVEYFSSLKSIFFSYFLVVAKRYKVLHEKLFPELNFTEYYKTVIQHYLDFRNAFIDLEVKEYIQIVIKEVFDPNSQKPARQGNVTDLRNSIPEKQMMLLGQPGMGKTTSLLFMAMTDAETLSKNPKSKIPLPVYVSLAAFSDKDETIVQRIAKRIERKVDFTQKYLEEGKITIFLDGFNEILPNLRENMQRKIQQFINDFPNVKIIIASRPLAYENIEFKKPTNNPLDNNKPIAAFLLIEMKENLVKNFIENNYNATQQEKIELFNLVKRHTKLFQMLQTPLYLAEFIKIYENKKELPDTTVDLTKRFLELKYLREYQKDANFPKEDFHDIMIQYTEKISMLDELKESTQNPQVPEEIAKAILKPLLKKTEINENKFLFYAVNMNILFHNKQDKTYFFAHQSYQDFYFAMGEKHQNAFLNYFNNL